MTRRPRPPWRTAGPTSQRVTQTAPAKPTAAERAERRAVAIGVITAVAGGALVRAPGRAGAVVGIADTRLARLVGVADLSLVPGLIAGHPRWPWLAARAAFNLPTAAVSTCSTATTCSSPQTAKSRPRPRRLQRLSFRGPALLHTHHTHRTHTPRRAPPENQEIPGQPVGRVGLEPTT